MGAENWSRKSLVKSLVIQFGAGVAIGLTLACLILKLSSSSVSLSLPQFFQRLRSPAVVIAKDIDVHSYEALKNSTGTTLHVLHQSPDHGEHAGEDAEAQRLTTQVHVVLRLFISRISRNHYWTKKAKIDDSAYKTPVPTTIVSDGNTPEVINVTQANHSRFGSQP